MARLHDNNGNLLGDYQPAHILRLQKILGTRPRNGSSVAVIAANSKTGHDSMAGQAEPDYDANEIVIGLECSYGTFAYSYTPQKDDNASSTSQRPGCHNPVERPSERHHCDQCGGDYCSVHAAPGSHDCDKIKR